MSTAAELGPERGVARFQAGLGGEMLAEFLGTFVLIMFGLGSVAVAVVGLSGSGRQSTAFGPANWLIIAWGWGLGVVFGVYIAGGVSGAHLNPAVTLALAVRRGFSWRRVPAYWFAQFLGAFAAAALVYAVYHAAIDAFNLTNDIASRSQSLATFSIFATFPASYFHGGLWVHCSTRSSGPRSCSAWPMARTPATPSTRPGTSGPACSPTSRAGDDWPSLARERTTTTTGGSPSSAPSSAG
jgi:hypothetical protein